MFKRIIKWWNRPSVDQMVSDYLYEHAAEIDAHFSRPSYGDLESLVQSQAKTYAASDARSVARIEELEAEIERLHGLLMSQVDQSPADISIGHGKAEITVRPPHWAARAIAESFLETLGDAPNWAAIEVDFIPVNGPKLIVTVQRASGDGPVETVGKLKECLGEMTRRFERAFRDRSPLNYDEDMACRVLVQHADELLNPTPKD